MQRRSGNRKPQPKRPPSAPPNEAIRRSQRQRRKSRSTTASESVVAVATSTRNQSKRRKVTRKKMPDVMEYVPHVRDKDVMMGRGPAVNNHPGNKIFRNLCKQYLTRYTEAQSKSVKTLICKEIVDWCVQEGIYVLEKDPSRNKWYHVHPLTARTKASQVIQDILKRKRNGSAEDDDVDFSATGEGGTLGHWKGECDSSSDDDGETEEEEEEDPDDEEEDAEEGEGEDVVADRKLPAVSLEGLQALRSDLARAQTSRSEADLTHSPVIPPQRPPAELRPAAVTFPLRFIGMETSPNGELLSSLPDKQTRDSFSSSIEISSPLAELSPLANPKRSFDIDREELPSSTHDSHHDQHAGDEGSVPYARIMATHASSPTCGSGSRDPPHNAHPQAELRPASVAHHFQLGDKDHTLGYWQWHDVFRESDESV